MAEIDLAMIEGAKVFADPGGHYFRPDVARYVLDRVASPVDAMPREPAVSLREAAGYLFQLKDLYWYRLTGPKRPRREYRQLSADEIT